MPSIKFVWNEVKNKNNIKKHRVSFEEAKSVFYDENAVEFFDDDHSNDEDRFLMLGLSYKLKILIVSFSTPQPNVIRIISARKAAQNELKYYHGV